MSVDTLASRPARAERLLDAVTINRTTDAGAVLGTVELDREFFSVAPNEPLVHQVVTAQLAARRRGTQSTRTRAEVRGGSAKPYRQKGTGAARQGSIRAPHYAGGGVALGPKPRDYSQRTPRKMVRQAYCCALSDRARSGAVRLIDRWTMEVPRTKAAVAALAALDCAGRVLIVATHDDDVVARSFRNLPGVAVLPGEQVTAYDLLAADVIVFTDETVPGSPTASSVAAKPVPKAAPTNAPAAKAPARKRTATDEGSGR